MLNILHWCDHTIVTYKYLELSLDSDETKATFSTEDFSNETGQKGDVHYCLNICQTAALILMAYSGHAIS